FSSFTQKLAGAWASEAYTPQVHFCRVALGRKQQPEAGSREVRAVRGFCRPTGPACWCPLVSLTTQAWSGRRGFWGLKPVSTEAPPIIFATPTKLTSSVTAYDYSGKNKVPELQKFFQKADGVPIHLKRGLPDQMLYRTTM
ncbi:cytochrome c oxidase subunit VIIa polypeptide 2-like, isoform CRA_b, partial [Mus musculus]